MALTFGSKVAPKSEENKAPSAASTEAKTTQKPSFLKTGKAAVSAFQTAEAAAEDQKNFTPGFYIKTLNKPYKIMFLDGNVNEEGLLDTPMFEEAFVKHAGKNLNIIRPDTSEGPDPCEGPDTKYALCQAFTIINLDPRDKEYKRIQKDGKDLEWQKRLFVCKRRTMKKLAMLAAKRGGLAGCVFEVYRTGDKTEAVGDMFEFDSKVEHADIVASLGTDGATPFNYEDVLIYRTRDELIAMGFGSGTTSGITSNIDSSSYEDQL